MKQTVKDHAGLTGIINHKNTKSIPDKSLKHVGMELPTVPVVHLDPEKDMPLWGFGGISQLIVIVTVYSS